MNRFKTNAARVALAKEIAGESMILLKNDGLLPISEVPALALLRQKTQPSWWILSRQTD